MSVLDTPTHPKGPTSKLAVTLYSNRFYSGKKLSFVVRVSLFQYWIQSTDLQLPISLEAPVLRVVKQAVLERWRQLMGQMWPFLWPWPPPAACLDWYSPSPGLITTQLFLICWSKVIKEQFFFSYFKLCSCSPWSHPPFFCDLVFTGPLNHEESFRNLCYHFQMSVEKSKWQPRMPGLLLGAISFFTAVRIPGLIVIWGEVGGWVGAYL